MFGVFIDVEDEFLGLSYGICRVLAFVERQEFLAFVQVCHNTVPLYDIFSIHSVIAAQMLFCPHLF